MQHSCCRLLLTSLMSCGFTDDEEIRDGWMRSTVSFNLCIVIVMYVRGMDEGRRIRDLVWANPEVRVEVRGAVGGRVPGVSR